LSEDVSYPLAEEFYLEHGRFPALGDQRPPWRYRGWLLNQIQLCHFHPAVVNRWGYYFKIFESGELGDDPIPRVDFVGHVKEGLPAYKNMMKCVDLLDRVCGGWASLYAFLDWLTFAIGVDKRPRREIDDRTQEQLYKTFNLEPWLVMPADYFGDVLCELKGKRNRTGFYPTPHNVCEMMARMTFFDAERDGAIDLRKATVCDPCVGTGRMLLHASNYSLRLFGQDIDPLVLQACLINGALYAPWIAWPFDKKIFEKDAPPAQQLTDDEIMEQAKRLAAERGAPDRNGTRGAAKAERMAKKVEGRKFPSDLVERKSIEGAGPAQDSPIIVLPSEVRYSESAEAVYTAIEQNLLFEDLGLAPKKRAGKRRK
jgi:hypothetical protein